MRFYQQNQENQHQNHKIGNNSIEQFMNSWWKIWTHIILKNRNNMWFITEIITQKTTNLIIYNGLYKKKIQYYIILNKKNEI